MSFLEKSERLWKARHTFRQRRLNYWVKRGDEVQIDKWEALRDEASRWLRRRRLQIAEKRDQLTDHFNVREFDCHDGREVPAKSIPALRDLCEEVLEPMRNRFGRVTVLSGYRPRDYNRSIGGATLSHHIYELYDGAEPAADVKFERGSPKEWASYARLLGQGGVGRYDRARFLHVDLGPVRYWTG